jgi:hypothetical protein
MWFEAFLWRIQTFVILTLSEEVFQRVKTKGVLCLTKY